MNHQRHLILMRHATAVSSSQNDAARDLTSLGIDEARAKGVQYRQDLLPLPERVFFSSARRTSDSCRLFLEAANLMNVHAEAASSIYNASLEALCEFVSELSSDWSNVMLVGHNPGCSELASHLSGEWLRFAPATVAVLRAKSDADWSELTDAGAWELWRIL